MSEDQSVIEQIRTNAALIIAVAADKLGVHLAYDEAGVRWLDGFIQRQHEAGNADNRDKLTSTLGSYLGECIIHCFGGAWVQLDGLWAIGFDDQNAVFPFAKVSKQLTNGQDDSVLSFFTAIPLLFKGKLGHRAPGDRGDP